jgi:hypothetical protein
MFGLTCVTNIYVFSQHLACRLTHIDVVGRCSYDTPTGPQAKMDLPCREHSQQNITCAVESLSVREVGVWARISLALKKAVREQQYVTEELVDPPRRARAIECDRKSNQIKLNQSARCTLPAALTHSTNRPAPGAQPPSQNIGRVAR